MFPLSCGVQNYAWGQIGAQSSIFSLTKQTDTTKPYAELWMGSHPNLPSQPLTDYIKENP
jgi:mannose-6-phosphate isomerase